MSLLEYIVCIHLYYISLCILILCYYVLHIIRFYHCLIIWIYFHIFTYSLCCLFFYKQKTAYEMRISDWSSDVCSSDLHLQCGRAWEDPDRQGWSGGGAALDRLFSRPYADAPPRQPR